MKVLISIQQPVHAVADSRRGRRDAARAVSAHSIHPRDLAGAARRRPCTTATPPTPGFSTTHELAQAPKLRWVHTSAVAVETLCLPELFARGIAVSNTRGVQAVPIAEHVMAVVLALAKQMPFVIENQQQARWAQNEFIGERLPWLLKGRTLGLIGVGTIGSEIAKRAEAFGMRVIALAPAPGLRRRSATSSASTARDELDDFLGAVPRPGDLPRR